MHALTFEPYFSPKVWGGRRLAERLGKPLPPEVAIGESWEVSGHPAHVSRIASGPEQGRLLSDVWETGSEAISGRPSSRPFPLLVKYLECRDRLSIQVHPNDRVAAELLGEPYGKSECWVILEAAAGSRIYAGFGPGVTQKDVLSHLEQDTLTDCLHQFTPQRGDCVFLPAGTVHAVSGGVLLAEVQQSSDATFRLYDWNQRGLDGRLRDLHVESALAAMDWEAGPVLPVRPQADVVPGTPVACELLVDSPHFCLRRVRLSEPLERPLPGRMAIWMVLEGTVRLHEEDIADIRRFEAGQTILVPATSAGATWEPVGTTPAELLAVTL